MSIRVKICGVTDPEALRAVAQAGAQYVGFVFFPKSPRHLSLEAARALALETPVGLAKVALLVDPDDAALDATLARVPLDMIQLNGRETPERVAAIKARSGLPIMKAVSVATEVDLPHIAAFAQVADQLLIEPKAPRDAALPGGNGLTFDWRLIAGRRWSRPWMLAGGLRPETVASAIAVTGAQQVDVSSGVESAPGRKDPARIAAFVAAAQKAEPAPRL